MTLFSLLLAALAATGACIAIWRGSGAYQSKRFELLWHRLNELEGNLGSLHGSVVGLRQRIAMREIRATKAQQRELELAGQRDEGLQLPDIAPLSDYEKTRQRLQLSRKLAAGNLSPMRPPDAT